MKSFLVLILGFFTTVWGQLTTTGGIAPGQLVQNVLLGNGVTVSNVTYGGSPGAIGRFTATNSNLGISSGIIITTGTILNNGQGPHGPNNVGNAGIDNGFPGSALLSNALGGVDTYNAATLEFDFVPFSDSVEFRYVFGSEEYPEFVGSNFNDVFGFFISGPGITGNQNIARLPNGAVVAINNVNGGNNTVTPAVPATNQQFYVSNNGGATVQYDGFTRVLTARAKVQCGATYHLSIAIADVGDGIYDSGIFLEANSLNSDTPYEVTAELSYEAFPDPLAMAEGCVEATIRIRRNKNLQNLVVVPISVSGTATPGVDYAPAIPASVTFQPGDSVKTFSIQSLFDGIAEPPENIIITFQVTDACGNQQNIPIELTIQDVEDVSVDLADTTVVCPADQITLIPQASGGVGPYSYLWSDGTTTPTLTVAPLVTSNYSVTVTDNCLNQSATATATVNVPVYPPLLLSTSNDTAVICPYIPDTLQAIASGGAGQYQYAWSANGVLLGTQPSLKILPPTTTVYTVSVRDRCNISTEAQITYTILSPPLTLEMSDPLTVCPFETVDLSVEASGGFGDYYYFWPSNGATTSFNQAQPNRTAYYVVEVMDDCQSFTVYDSVLITVLRPKADFSVLSGTVMAGLPINFYNQSTGANQYYWDFGNGNYSNLIHGQSVFANAGAYDVLLVAQNEIGCLDSIVKSINILEETYLYIPNAFTPDNDRHNNYFRASTIGVLEFNIQIFNRWGELIFEANDPNFAWDGTDKKGELVKQDVYPYIIKYSTRYEVDQIKQGHVSVIK